MAFSSEMSMESEAIKVTQEAPGGMSAVDEPEKVKINPRTPPRARPCPRSRKPVEARKLLEEEEAKTTEGGDQNPDEDERRSETSTGKEETPEEVSPSPARKRSRPSTSSAGGGNVPDKAKQEAKSEVPSGGNVEPPYELDYIIDVRTVKEYRCKWKGGLAQDEDTWIHQDDLHFKEAISEFEKRMGVAKNGKEHAGGKKGGPSKDHGPRPSKRPSK